MTAQSSITAVDLFCGVGGLTRGLSNAGINVKLGVDLDPACEFPLEENNDTRFLQGDVSKLKASTLKKELKGSKISLLAGCAPCQPFSSYSNSKESFKSLFKPNTAEINPQHHKKSKRKTVIMLKTKNKREPKYLIIL